MGVELPEAVAERTAGMGEPIAEFRVGRWQSAVYLGLGVMCLALGAGAIVFLVVALANEPAGRGGYGKAGWLALLLLGGGVATLKKWNDTRGSGVIVFRDGLARVRRGECEVMRWEEVRVVRRGRPPGREELTIRTPQRLTIGDAGGRQWQLTEDLGGLKEVREAVEELTLEPMLRCALEALGRGEAVAFGGVAVTPAGLAWPGRPVLPWRTVQGVEVARGKVLVTSSVTRGPYGEAALYDVPNVHLLIALARRLCRLENDKWLDSPEGTEGS